MSLSAEAVELTVNGRKRRFPAAVTVEQLIDSLGQDPRTVAVECDGVIVRRSDYASTQPRPGARLEIVRFVQGG